METPKIFPSDTLVYACHYFDGYKRDIEIKKSSKFVIYLLYNQVGNNSDDKAYD